MGRGGRAFRRCRRDFLRGTKVVVEFWVRFDDLCVIGNWVWGECRDWDAEVYLGTCYVMFCQDAKSSRWFSPMHKRQGNETSITFITVYRTCYKSIRNAKEIQWDLMLLKNKIRTLPRRRYYPLHLSFH
jgi:hypothetical protein